MPELLYTSYLDYGTSFNATTPARSLIHGQNMGEGFAATDNSAISEDRKQRARGSTPLLEVGNVRIHPDYLPDYLHPDRSEEYRELLR